VDVEGKLLQCCYCCDWSYQLYDRVGTGTRTVCCCLKVSIWKTDLRVFSTREHRVTCD
jgi:hypothetical protein